MSNSQIKKIDGDDYKWIMNAGKEYFKNLTTIRNRIIDEPKPTQKYTLNDLKKMGIIGLWEKI